MVIKSKKTKVINSALLTLYFTLLRNHSYCLLFNNHIHIHDLQLVQ